MLAAACAAGVMTAIAVLYLSARFVMEQGGFVARGGPYVIAHPAPGWVWIMPVSIWVGLVLTGVHTLAAGRAGGFRLLGFVWVALFASLGWAFMDFGFNPPWGGRVWGWIVCGVAFWLMALPVVLVWLGSLFPGVRAKLLSRFYVQPHEGDRHSGGTFYLAVHLVAIPVGLYLGVLLFGSVSGAA